MLQGKVVLVTGAGGGIGRHFALAMAAAGAKVVVNDLGTSVKGEGADTGPAFDVVKTIKSKGGDAVASTDSVADWTSANRIVQAALDAFGRIDTVVNNAGILRDRFFFNMSVEEWRAVIDVHLNGSFYVARAAAPHFKAQESGCYVHMTSTSGLVGNLGQANYSAAKLGIVGLSKSIALDMAKYHVRSNCIAPFAWSRMIGSIPAETPDQRGAGREAQDHGDGEDCAARGVSRFRCSAGGERADLCRSGERDLPHVAEPAATLGASRRRLDGRNDSDAGDTGAASAVLRARALAGRL